MERQPRLGQIQAADELTDAADGIIVGWLSKEKSDFFEESGKPAALWRLMYDNVLLGEEDLEEGWNDGEEEDPGIEEDDEDIDEDGDVYQHVALLEAENEDLRQQLANANNMVPSRIPFPDGYHIGFEYVNGVRYLFVYQQPQPLSLSDLECDYKEEEETLSLIRPDDEKDDEYRTYFSGNIDDLLIFPF
jgi:hypothetical protein